jgi:hypothetical protein
MKQNVQHLGPTRGGPAIYSAFHVLHMSPQSVWCSNVFAHKHLTIPGAETSSSACRVKKLTGVCKKIKTHDPLL